MTYQRNTYWFRSPSNFANQYIIGVATNVSDADSYTAENYQKISRDSALAEMVWRGDAATQAFVSVTLDGADVEDRFGFARSLRRAGGYDG